MPGVREQLVATATRLLAEAPAGMRWAELRRRLIEELPHIKRGNIAPTLNNLVRWSKEQVVKPAKGTFLHAKYVDGYARPDGAMPPSAAKLLEESFYALFAQWLTDELEECTRAVPVGGAKFRDKWGAPDVIGVLKPRASDIIKFSVETMVAEIKVDTTGGLITAFGQACAYRLFAHRSYIAVPETSPKPDLERLESLAMVLGIGLIVFDSSRPDEPNFKIRTRAVLGAPDMFYANKIMAEMAPDLLD